MGLLDINPDRWKMTTRFSAELYFPIDRLKEVFRGVALFAELDQPADAVEFALAEITGQDLSKCLDVVLPNGERLQLPFKLEFEKAPVHLGPWRRVFFNTVLRFPVDPVLHKYLQRRYRKADERRRQLVVIDGIEEARIGYINLVVSLGNRYAEFSFSAVDFQMSLLFNDSRSIHDRFQRLLETCGGLFGLLSRGGNEPSVLGNEGQSIWVDQGQFMRMGNTSEASLSRHDVDGLVEEVLGQLGRR